MLGFKRSSAAMANHRSSPILKALRDLPCMASFPHVCNGPSIPCHANDLLFGRGFAHKTPDHFTAACCPEAHDYIDGRRGGWDKETKRAEWLRAYVRTQNALWESGRICVK